MYIYDFELVPSKKFIDINYEKYSEILNDAINYINRGLAFKRDGKSIFIEKIEKERILVKLTSSKALPNPARSLSALTRYLTTYYPNIFSVYIYNKTLFTMKLVTKNELISNSSYEISDEEMLKTLIDLLYAYTATSNADTQNRKKTIIEIKKLLEPYINK